ncbi:LysR family transcriptional regulator [Mesorhizobium sp. B2-4-16]|nr:LysR family transcriptional regulator [Mesorhizobium sp. B2-4-16]TPL78436.1 LysR family transcriptional regulator [Mesorhizobium sp. B2-4-3]
MNLRQVEAFRAVMLTGTMTAASELLSITQPAVSRLIRDFEHSTKLLLFERRGNQITPTLEAATLMQEVERSFIGMNRIATVADDINRQAAGTLRVAAMPALGSGILPRFLAKFLHDKPKVHAALIAIPSSMVIESVALGQADVGYADGPLDRPGFRIETRQFAAVVAIPIGHRLAARERITPQDLIGERMISLDPGSIFAMRVEVALAGILRAPVIETRLSYTALTLVSEGAGAAIVDPTSAYQFVGRGVEIRPFSVFVDAGFLVIRRANVRQSAIVQRFVKEFWAYHDEVVPNSQ